MDRRPAVLTCFLLLIACNRQTPADVLRDVRARVPVGTPLALAIARLDAAGFGCSPATGGVDCARQVTRNPLVTCVQRVDLALDARTRVAAVTVRPHACFGGLG